MTIYNKILVIEYKTYTKLQYHNPHMQTSGIHEGTASSVLPQFQHMICGLNRIWEKQFIIKV